MQVQSSELEDAYKREKDARVKERILLIMLIKDGRKPAHAARELHRAKSWAYTWRDRYDAEGIEGLRDKPRSGRPPRVSEKVQMSLCESHSLLVIVLKKCRDYIVGSVRWILK